MLCCLLRQETLVSRRVILKMLLAIWKKFLSCLGELEVTEDPDIDEESQMTPLPSERRWFPKLKKRL